MKPITALALLLTLSLLPTPPSRAAGIAAYTPPAPGEEFVGPFPSWANVKTEYGAVGDGKADDTAAIQRALEDVRRLPSPKKVLYFPAGVYRITSTLHLDRISHNEPLGMSIVGEDPEKTILRWDGPTGQSLFLYNAWYASLSRLTFDGEGKAKTAIQHGPAFTTANEFTDLVIRDVEFGIEAGMRDGIAETAVLRCRFYHCSKTAISIQNFNTLDWYIWDCWFQDCNRGVTNEFGAGNFHVYRSVFLRSADSDISIRHTGYFSFVGNTSIGSNTFFHARRAAIWKPTETWGSQATLQDNLILDPRDPSPVQIENNGPNMLVDNVIRASGPGPLVVNEPPSEVADLICIGNTWTAAAPIRIKGRLTELDNRVVRSAQIREVHPQPAPFLPRVDRPIIELSPGADTSAIQAAIDRAAALKRPWPVVHLPKGNYSITRTLVIPAGAELQIVGDGPENATQLTNGGAVNPVIRVEGPCHAIFRNFLLKAGKNAVGIEVAGCDQDGARIFGEQLNANGYEYGIVTKGLRRARVEIRDAGHNGIQVNGGGPDTRSWVALFCGGSSRDSEGKPGIHLYDVQNGGQLLVRDIWYEGQGYSMFDLTGSGTFAFHSAFMAPYDPNHGARLDWESDFRQTVVPLEVDNFKGKVALTLISVSGGDFRVVPPSPDLKLYLLGFLTNRGIDLGGAAIKGQVVADHTRLVRSNQTGSDAADSVGQASPDFIREMLQPLRDVLPQPLHALPNGVTDVRFYRVWADGLNGVRVDGGG